MKFALLLPLAALAAAIVIPDEQVFLDLAQETRDKLPDHQNFIDDASSSVDDAVESSKDFLGGAFSYVSEAGAAAYKKIFDAAYDIESWLQNSIEPNVDFTEEAYSSRLDHPHHGHKPNLTVYELISKSKYTTKLAKLISEVDELVEILNGTAANYTVFAPTDRAFAKIPKDAPKPTKKQILDVLSYHVSPEFYPAGRVLASHTIGTLFKSSSLGVNANPQRLAVKLGLKGLAINFYSRVIAVNIFGTNGVIHAVDSIIVPPPDTLSIIGYFPGEFSTLSLGLERTGLLEALNNTIHYGSTIFAPSNFAFQKLGPKINGFLFSKYGEKYLKALLQYHVVMNQTLYSDAFYRVTDVEDTTKSPNGYFHVDLPTQLEDRALSVDIAKYGPFITIKINGFASVVVQDGVANDGVIQVVGDVLIPPKKLGENEMSYWKGEEMSVEDFKERLEPFIEDEQSEL